MANKNWHTPAGKVRASHICEMAFVLKKRGVIKHAINLTSLSDWANGKRRAGSLDDPTRDLKFPIPFEKLQITWLKKRGLPDQKIILYPEFIELKDKSGDSITLPTIFVLPTWYDARQGGRVDFVQVAKDLVQVSQRKRDKAVRTEQFALFEKF